MTTPTTGYLQNQSRRGLRSVCDKLQLESQLGRKLTRFVRGMPGRIGALPITGLLPRVFRTLSPLLRIFASGGGRGELSGVVETSCVGNTRGVLFPSCQSAVDVHLQASNYPYRFVG